MRKLLNDKFRVDVISAVIVKNVSRMLNEEVSPLRKVIEAGEGYNGLSFPEYHLATVKAFAELHAQALEKFMLLERD